MSKLGPKWIVYGMVLMLMAMVPISAIAGATPNGQPFLEIWEELEDLQEQIRNHPENSRYRIFLFQLLAVIGQWERALSQLNVLDKLEKDTWPMVQMYREAIQCEVLRAEIFAGRQQPLIFGEPPPWMAWLLESLRLMPQNNMTRLYRCAIRPLSWPSKIPG